MNQLTLITAAVQSTAPFPVDFDQLWKWAGFSSKGNAKTLLSARMKEGRDFEISLLPNKKRVHGGQNAQAISLTLDAAKAFCMLAQTDRGDEIRYAFIAAEKELASIKQNPAIALPIEMAMLVKALMDTHHAGYLAANILKLIGQPLAKYGSEGKNGKPRLGFRAWCPVASNSRLKEAKEVCGAIQGFFEFATAAGLIQITGGGK